MILLNAPEPRESSGVHDLEHTRVVVLPRNEVAVLLRRIVQELLQKVPQEPPACNAQQRFNNLFICSNVRKQNKNILEKGE
jgi:hypothetical protein